MVPILILAAGASTRMRGRDKLLEPVADQPLLRHVAQVALASGQRVLVALPVGAPSRQAALDGLAVQIVPVPDAAEGMAASIRAGVASLPPGATALILMLADMPEVTANDLSLLIAAHQNDPNAILRGASPDGTAGHPVLVPARFHPDLTTLSGDTGARALLAANPTAVRLIPLPFDHATTDLDTPEAWARWRAMIRPPATP